MATKETPAAEWAYVTPEIASDWLGMNIRNRNVRQNVVDRLALDYADYHPSPISRASDGTLLDGQHRMMAIVKRQRGAWVLVVQNVDPSMQDIIDTGTPRSGSDVLALNGYINTNTLASAARICIAWEAAPLLTHLTGAGKIMPVDVLRYVQQHPELIEHVGEAISIAKRAPGLNQPPASRLAVCRVAIANAYGIAFADSFLRSLMLGVDISEGSVIYVTRTRLVSISSGKDHAISLTPDKNTRMTMWMVLRCAVAHRNGENLRKLLYKSDQTPMPILLDGTITSGGAQA